MEMEMEIQEEKKVGQDEFHSVTRKWGNERQELGRILHEACTEHLLSCWHSPFEMLSFRARGGIVIRQDGNITDAILHTSIIAILHL